MLRRILPTAHASDQWLREHTAAGQLQSAHCGCDRCGVCILHRHRLVQQAASRQSDECPQLPRPEETPATLPPSPRSDPALAGWRSARSTKARPPPSTLVRTPGLPPVRVLTTGGRSRTNAANVRNRDPAAAGTGPTTFSFQRLFHFLSVHLRV